MLPMLCRSDGVENAGSFIKPAYSSRSEGYSFVGSPGNRATPQERRDPENRDHCDPGTQMVAGLRIGEHPPGISHVVGESRTMQAVNA